MCQSTSSVERYIWIFPWWFSLHYLFVSFYKNWQPDTMWDLCKLHTLYLLSSPPPHLSVHPCLSYPLIHKEETQGRHYRAFGCLWVTLPHICRRLGLSKNLHALADSVGCVRAWSWPHFGRVPDLFERLEFPMLTLWMKHGRTGCVTHLTEPWGSSPHFYSDWKDQLVAIVKRCYGPKIKAGTGKENTIQSSKTSTEWELKGWLELLVKWQDLWLQFSFIIWDLCGA